MDITPPYSEAGRRRAILLECLGYSVESDRGGAYAYIESYCREHKPTF
jgi:hypothetical protein